jgi:hypothetical protein
MVRADQDLDVANLGIAGGQKVRSILPSLRIRIRRSRLQWRWRCVSAEVGIRAGWAPDFPRFSVTHRFDG